MTAIRWCALAVSLIAALPAQAQEARKAYERDLITPEEIQDRAPDAGTAYDVIKKLRPHFLRERSTGQVSSPMPSEGTFSTRNPAERQPVQVYINGAKHIATTAALRELNADAILDIAYLNASDATTRFGTGHNNGAILVRTK